MDDLKRKQAYVDKVEKKDRVDRYLLLRVVVIALLLAALYENIMGLGEVKD